MTQYFDSRGQVVRVGKQLGTGGEGSVFELSGNSRFVAKIYHRPVALEKVEKLRLMAAVASDELLRFAALPVATLSTSLRGPVVGLVMPRVNRHTEIHNLYSPAHRKLNFPDKDWLFLVHVAMNCAASFDALHQKSIVIGDVNQGNVLVSDQGKVFLIDCDSFQMKANGTLYPCEVGVPHFTPPELQGCTFRDVERTTNHDLFGLAVLVFHLLCMGRHPYAGRFLGSGEMPIEKAIAEYRYAYGPKATTLQMAPPPQTLELSVVMPQLATLFERAFSKGSANLDSRPTALDWHAALQEFRNAMTLCPRDKGHRYPQSLTTCPWCKLQKDGAPNFFISISAKAFTAGNLQLTFEVEQLWARIESVTAPIQLNSLKSPKPHQNTVIPADLPEQMQQSIFFCRLIGRISIAAMLGGCLYFVNHFLGMASAGVGIVFSIWWIILQSTSGIGVERRRRRHLFATARDRVRQLEKDVWLNRKRPTEEFHRMKNSLADTKKRILGLKPQYESELNLLRSQRERVQRDTFLQSIFICDHKIDLVGPSRLSQLSSYGIETAFDLDWERIRSINGFGNSITSNLMAWKSLMEGQFRFNPNQALSQSQLQALITKYVQVKQHLTSTLEDGYSRLVAIRQAAFDAATEYQKEHASALEILTQAKADISVFEKHSN